MFKFAVYYLFDKTLKVESTSLILGSDEFTQVASKPDLDDDANWIEIEPNRTCLLRCCYLEASMENMVMGNGYTEYLCLLFQLGQLS